MLYNTILYLHCCSGHQLCSLQAGGRGSCGQRGRKGETTRNGSLQRGAGGRCWWVGWRDLDLIKWSQPGAYAWQILTLHTYLNLFNYYDSIQFCAFVWHHQLSTNTIPGFVYAIDHGPKPLDSTEQQHPTLLRPERITYHVLRSISINLPCRILGSPHHHDLVTDRKKRAQSAPKLHFGASLPKPSALRVRMQQRNQAPLQRQKWFHPLEAWQVVGIGLVLRWMGWRRLGFDMSPNQHVKQRSPQQFVCCGYWILYHVWVSHVFLPANHLMCLYYKLATAIWRAIWNPRTSERFGRLSNSKCSSIKSQLINGGKWNSFHLVVSFADATGTHQGR